VYHRQGDWERYSAGPGAGAYKYYYVCPSTGITQWENPFGTDWVIEETAPAVAPATGSPDRDQETAAAPAVQHTGGASQEESVGSELRVSVEAGIIMLVLPPPSSRAE
jgi:hypothetical protein